MFAVSISHNTNQTIKIMSYLEEIKPYIKYVLLYNEGKGSPNYEIKQKISEVYDRLRHKESSIIFGKKNAQITPTDLGCSRCIATMMVEVEKWYHYKLKENTVEFKGVPQIHISQEEKETVRPDQLSWGDFKTYCKDQGLKVKGKTKVQLLDELSKL